ncbi:NADPH:quinone reductase-like Zn-dependent oxidoreductase [Silvibacterium bohemicum]|uniref:NADPH:quinone reductase-like Zn-dependent oxidoreductase n=1 Tax=Silvibacterium bohemicum TaxID=1577686 RepID=A0A841K1Q3_9BACT|nr:NADP-dependent oxidoreductase [Silvibacterium bohemicum]MBB6146517.1 NADPH:quinone reductase-like Zn-dependent oxidoreductase [Silvibacterium bohemicum]
MKAILLYAYGDASQLRLEDTEIPPYGDNEVLIRMRATSINPVDLKIRSGAAKARMPVEFPAILGRDLAGEVEAAGAKVTGFPKGMRVMALANGTYAEYTVAKADVLAPIPDALDFPHAAAIPLVTLTGAQLIERAVKPKPGQTVLVTGALGGVGRTAVHVARKHGARVLAGVRGAQKEDARTLGADGIVALDDEAELAHLHDLDAVADTVGGTTVNRLLKAIRAGGVLGSVLGEPAEAHKYDIRVEAFMAQPDASRLYALADEVARGEFSIPIARILPLSGAVAAHRMAEEGNVGGKIVLVM